MSKREELAKKRAALAQRKAGLNSDDRSKLAERLSRKNVSHDFIPRRISQEAPLASHNQEHLWNHYRSFPKSAAYNMPLALRIRGPLKLEGLSWALDRLIQRHQILRTNFRLVERGLVQVIHPEFKLVLPVQDLSEMERDQKETTIQAEAARFAREPFCLENEALLRFSLMVLGPDEHCLLWCMHHIISDGWSMGVFVRETAALYYAFINAADLGVPPTELPPLMIQFADYTEWSRQQLAGERGISLANWWRTYLPGDVPPLQLPLDYQRPESPSFMGHNLGTDLGLEVSNALESLAREEKTSVYILMLTVCHYLLHRYSGQDQIVTGTWIANRERSEVGGLIGLFAGLMPLYSSFSGLDPDISFRDLLRRVRTATLDAFAHQQLPLPAIQQAIGAGNPGQTPFRVLCVFQNWPASRVEATDMLMEPLEFEYDQARFDLSFTLQQVENQIGIALNYNTGLFAENTAATILRHYAKLLELVVADPDGLMKLHRFHTAEDEKLLA